MSSSAHPPASHDLVDVSHEPLHHHDEAALPEPETPTWLTMVGFLLFVAGGIVWVVAAH